MKRTIVILAAGTIAAILASSGLAKIFEDEANNFKIAVPKGWDILDVSQLGDPELKLSIRKDNYFLYIFAEENPSGMRPTVDKLFGGIDPRKVPTKDIVFKGFPGKVVETQQHGQGETISLLITLFATRDKLYGIGRGGIDLKEEPFKHLSSYFSSIVDSFEFITQPDQPLTPGLTREKLKDNKAFNLIYNIIRALLIPIILIILIVKWKRDKRTGKFQEPSAPTWGRFFKRLAWIIVWLSLLAL